MKKHIRFSSILAIYIIVLGFFLLIAFAGSRAVTALSENAPFRDRKCVIVDAGHGGEDGGATSCTGVLESKINLEVALKLDDLLHLLGIDTLMIRDTDRSIYIQGNTIASKKVSDLKERVRIVNETENALLVSIHQNHYTDSQYSGAQVFYADTNKSEDLARDIQTTISKALSPSNHRQVKKSNGIYLMEHIKYTGVLVECGFLSNPEEEALLRSPEYQKKLCCVLASCISNFLDQEEGD